MIALNKKAATALRKARKEGITTDMPRHVIATLQGQEIVTYCGPNGCVMFDQDDLIYRVADY